MRAVPAALLLLALAGCDADVQGVYASGTVVIVDGRPVAGDGLVIWFHFGDGSMRQVLLPPGGTQSVAVPAGAVAVTCAGSTQQLAVGAGATTRLTWSGSGWAPHAAG